jgi:hypothetical protein
MAFEGNSGLQVANQYGPRGTGVTIGVEQTNGNFNRLSIELTGRGIAEGFSPPIVLPKGAIIRDAYVYVDEAFSGLTNISIGQGNAEATNGITLLAVDLAVGGKKVTDKLTGTWAAGTPQTQASNVKFVKTGTVLPTQGRASIVIEYVYKRRKDNEFAAVAGTFPTYKAQPQV